jgi:uncharacterized protein involved in type VI secretion and phage assembly
MPLLGRDTSVTGPFPKGVLLLETLKGREAPYVFELGLLSTVPNLDPNDVLGMPLAIGLKLNSGEERFFHGIVTAFYGRGKRALLSPMLRAVRGVLPEERAEEEADREAV